MIYFAHRGANTLRVQNTIPAFALAHAQGSRMFELDVHLLKDGNLAVHHDYSLLSTCGVDVKLADLTCADLQKYPLNNRFSNDKIYIPLLQEVLPVITPGLALLNVELKNDGNCYPGIESVLLKTLFTAYEDRVLFSSFDYETLVRLRALAPQARLGWLTRQFDVEKALALGVESVHINHTRFTPQMAQICHAHQLKVYCYTVNEKPLAPRLATEGADGIFTDDVTVF